uniref:ubiquitinyl hydrolase 1 n=1 Tax=Callorhinchus milii TaxID=7868 RepID=A0A4W3H3W1_CALMI
MLNIHPSLSIAAKIQGMKNGVPKNDKKRRKQLVEDVAKLEAELEQRHEQELEQLNQPFEKSSTVESFTNGIKNLELEASDEKEAKSRVSKAQKRRERKAAQDKEREERIAEAEVENLKGARHLESQKLAEILAKRHLQIKQIPSDGHCMYKATEDQLKKRDIFLTLAELRAQAAEYMRSHVDDFLPFLTNPNTGDMFSSEEFEKYCDEVSSTPAWGGQLELRALSHVLKMTVEVIQADSPPITIGEEYRGTPIILVYMRHAYGLGEHYNSVEQLTDKPTEDP